MANQYVALADVVESREVADRGSLRERLSVALTSVNYTRREATDTTFKRVTGIGEFGGILRDLRV